MRRFAATLALWVATSSTSCGDAASQGLLSDPAPTGPGLCEQLGAVMTESGAVRGSPNDDTCAFLGIPYAKSPSGERRFATAERIEPWEGVREASRFGAACPQPFGDEIIGEEDCLTLNVWSPAGERNPTFVFIHGGGNVSGSSRQAAYAGQHLAAAEGLVVVSLNYRLGPLGYFEHPLLGNGPYWSGHSQGFGDQMLALDWVQRNVEAFGGDPDNITVVGQSAGGRAVCGLLRQPSASLHRAAILSATCDVEERLAAQQLAVEIGERLDCNDLACLRRADIASLLTASPSLPSMVASSLHNIVHASPPLIWNTPMKPIPLLVGSTADEVAATIGALPNEAAYVALLASQLGEQGAEAVRERYFEGTEDLRSATTAAYTDARYTCPGHRTVLEHALDGDAMRFRYVLDRPLDGDEQSSLGSYHGLDLVYLFGTFEELGYEPSTRDLEFSRSFMRWFGNFARFGHPGGESFDSNAAPWQSVPSAAPTSALAEVTQAQPALDYLGQPTTVLSDSPTLVDGFRGEHCAFWLER